MRCSVPTDSEVLFARSARDEPGYFRTARIVNADPFELPFKATPVASSEKLYSANDDLLL